MLSSAATMPDENDPLIKNEETSKLSFLRSFLEISAFSGPFAFSRFATALAVVGNGIAYSRFGDDATAAGALSLTVIYAVIGPARGMLSASGMLIGKKHGEITDLIKKGQHSAAEIEKKNIGRLVNNGLLLGTLLLIPGLGIMMGAGAVFKATGVATAHVADQVQTYLFIYSTGLPALYYNTGDQQFLLGVHHKNIPTVVNLATPILGMAVGYPLAFGTSLGIQGVAIGLTTASWLVFLGLRAYMRRDEYKPYGLFNQFCTKPGREFLDLMKLGLPLGFQSLTEWGNLLGVSMLIGANGKNAAVSSAAAFQIGSALTQMINSTGHATAIKLSIVYGQLTEAIKNGEHQLIQTYHANIKNLGTAGIVLGAAFSVVASSFICGFSKPISSVFTNPHNVTQAVTDDILITAQAILITNSIGMMIDSVRLIAGSALSASKDVLFAPILGLLSMSVMGMSLGGVFSLVLEWGSNWLFITRDVGILLAAIGLAYRWAKKDHVVAIENDLNMTPGQSVTSFGLFKKADDKSLVVNEAATLQPF